MTGFTSTNTPTTDPLAIIRETSLETLRAKYKTTEAFLEFLADINYSPILQYYTARELHRQKYSELFDCLKIDFSDSCMLELGPAYANALDIARERGARLTACVDYDPYVVLINELKGHQSFKINHITEELSSLLPQKYDVILSRGSVQVCGFEKNDYWKNPAVLRFEKWISLIESLASEKSHIILCPTFRKHDQQKNGIDHYCKDLSALRKSNFTELLLDRGYQILFFEKNGFNNAVGFPITFYKSTGTPSVHYLKQSRHFEGSMSSALPESPCLKCMRDDNWL